MNNKTKTVVGVGLLTALVIVLQALAIGIRFGAFSITLVLVPIIVGAALYGYLAGAWLGFVFGVIVVLTDAGVFLAVNIPGTIITCILKGTCAGLIAGFLYKKLEDKNAILAVIVAAVAAPIVNTGLFLIGCRLFFLDTIKAWADAAGFSSAIGFMLFGLVGINFIVELIINLVLSMAIVRIVQIGKRMSLEK